MSGDDTTTGAAVSTETAEQGANSAGESIPADDEGEKLSESALRNLENAARGIPPPKPGEEPPEDDAQDGETASANTPEKPNPAAPARLNSRQMQAAERAGLDSAAIDALGTRAAAVLDKLADGFDSISAHHGKAGTEQEQQRQAAETASIAFQLDSPFSLGFKAAKNPDGSMTYTLGDQEYEADYVEGIIRPQEQAIESMRQVVLGLAQAATQDQVARFFETLDPAVAPIYGGGPLKAKPGSAEQQACQALIDKAGELAQSYRAAGKPFSITQSLNEALAIHGKDHFKKAALDSVREAARNRKGQFIQRASQRQPVETYKTPRQRAVAAAEAKIAELGLKDAVD